MEHLLHRKILGLDSAEYLVANGRSCFFRVIGFSCVHLNQDQGIQIASNVIALFGFQSHRAATTEIKMSNDELLIGQHLFVACSIQNGLTGPFASTDGASSEQL